MTEYYTHKVQETNDRVKAERKDLTKLFKNEAENHEELFRYITAWTELKKDENDWDSLCAIHGDGYPESSIESMTPLIDRYHEQYDEVLVWNENNAQYRIRGAFCGHHTPLFLLWHRVYMLTLEVLLQKHDPHPDPNKPLALHYWAWDLAPSGSGLPRWLTDDTLLKGRGDLPNPFLCGRRQRTLSVGVPNPRWAAEIGGHVDGIGPSDPPMPTGPFTTRDHVHYKGLQNEQLFELHDAMQVPNYLQVADMNAVLSKDDKFSDFEEPHNYLHGEVGGDFGDMSDTSNASWDPIFWLHHSNVERHHCAWFAKHHEVPLPTSLPSKMTDKGVVEDSEAGSSKKVDMIDFQLFPFPSKAVLESEHAYHELPFVRGVTAEHNKGLTIATAKEFLVYNEDLSYKYDNLIDVGRAPTRFELKILEVQQHMTKVTLKGVGARGTGFIHVILDYKGHQIPLLRRALFGFKGNVPCVNCDANPMNLTYHVPFRLHGIEVDHSVLPTVHSAVFKERGRCKEGVPVQVREVAWFNPGF